MKHLLLSILLLSISYSFGQTDWLFLQGDVKNDSGDGIVIDSKGYIYVVGFFEDEVDFNPGSGVNIHQSVPGNYENVFIQKYTPDQTLIWVRTFGDGGGISAIRDVVIDNDDNIYIAGSFVWSPDFKPGPFSYNLTSQSSSDGFVAKYDNQGDLIWAKGLQGYDIQSVTDLAVDAENNVYFTGYFRGDVDLDPNIGTAIETIHPSTFYQGFNGFIGKWDSAGQFIWGGNYQCEDCRGEEIEVNADGEIYLIGMFRGDLDVDIAPSATVISRNQTSIFVVKMDSLTNILWVKAIDGTDNGVDSYRTNSHTATLDDSGNLYIGGSFSGHAFFGYGDTTYNYYSNGSNFDGFIQKLNPSGNHLWTKVFGSIYSDYVSDIKTSSDGQLFATGSFRDSVLFNDSNPLSFAIAQGTDIYVMSWNQDGSFNWVETIGGTCNYGVGVAIVYDGNHSLYGTGVYRGPIENVSGQIIYGNGDEDCIVFKTGGHLGIPVSESDVEFKVYPNPTTDWITIESSQNSIVKLYSIEGKLIKSFEVKGKSTIEVKGFESGVYNLQYTTDRQKGNVRLVIN